MNPAGIHRPAACARRPVPLVRRASGLADSLPQNDAYTQPIRHRQERSPVGAIDNCRVVDDGKYIDRLAAWTSRIMIRISDRSQSCENAEKLRVLKASGAPSIVAAVADREGGCYAASVSELLFSYGTLRQPDVQLATFGRELDGYVDAIIGYDLDYVTITDPHVIATSGSDRHPILRPTSRPDAHVDGTVFTISDAELAAADEYEVDDYRRISVPLRSGPRAWVYVFAG